MLGFAIGCSVGGGSTDRGHLVVLHIDQGLLASIAARTSALLRLVVGGDVEGNEQDEVRRDNSDSGKRSEFFSRTLATVRHPLEVSGSEIRIRSKVDKPWCSVSRGSQVPLCSHPTNLGQRQIVESGGV